MNSESALPLLSIDFWRRQSGVEDVLRRLVVAVTEVRPDNVMTFIHQWSASGSASTAMRRGRHEDGKGNPLHLDFVKRSSRKRSYSLEWPFKPEANEQERNDQQEPRPERSSDAKWVREEKPTVQELQSFYMDARESPYEFLLGRDDYAARFERDNSISLSTNSFGLCLGRGNYGFVVPAIPKSSLQGGSMRNLSSGSSEEEILRAVDQGCVIAIKVSRVQALWSLDEVNSLSRVTVSRQHLEREVQRLQEQIEAQRASHEDGAAERYRFSQHHPGQQLQEGEEQPTARPTENVNVNDLEAHLLIQSRFLQGARHITTLVGDVMYDAQRDVLLFPLEFYPSTLAECTRARRRRCLGSLPIPDSFPDVRVNAQGGTAMTLLFSVQEMRHVVGSLCQALHFLHTVCGLTHLDIKADNILLSNTWLSDGSGATHVVPPHVVLGDLGLAQPIGAPILQLGDFATMAPEVYWADMSDEAKYAAYRTDVFCASSDIWSVGCVLLQMANGLDYAAWPADDVFPALEENFIAPSFRHPQVWPMGLNDFVVRCFERDPRRRMNAAAALQHPFLAGL